MHEGSVQVRKRSNYPHWAKIQSSGNGIANESGRWLGKKQEKNKETGVRR